MFSKSARKTLLLLSFILTGLTVLAGNDPEYRQTLFGKDGQLYNNNTVYTVDLNFEAYKNVTGAIENTYYVKNAVRLMIDEESPWFISSDFDVTMELEITTESANGTVTTLAQHKFLTISYKTAEGVTSGAITSFEFKDAVKVTAKIVNITKNVTWDVTKNLKLVNEIISLRDWGFTCSTSITGIITDSLFYDEWKIKWNAPANFQTEYDVEWAWIDESAIEDYKTNGVVDVAKIFDNNTTRVSTTNTYYRIPLLYEDNGRIYVRVRMTQQKVTGLHVEGNWFYLSDNGQGYLATNDGHEQYLNWQATTTFAEEGKRKTVIQYFDGTLRGRQMVTKDNTTKTTVVAETFYDFQGRPVIQVLPSPTLNTIIQFTKSLNQFDDSRTAKSVYDNLDINQSSCNKLTAKMLNTVSNSASQYYSSQNPLANDGFNKFIPDAEGYPYTETRYTNDGTGRIDAQGGVGPVFQINGGRETKYFYESVDQDDLDGLFGTDAGYASHYTKTWVKDANGQYSVSYVDMKGRTVATALAGGVPENLKALPSFPATPPTITRQLIDPETNNLQGNSIVSSKSLIVPKAGDYHFNYHLSPEKLRMMLCAGTEFCFDCLYELNISVIPDCADEVIPNFTNPVVVRNFTLGEYLSSCTSNGSPLLDADFTVHLEEGAYTVVKELKLSQEAKNYYREQIFLANDTCKTRANFVLQQYQLAVAQQNCYITCTECNTKLGTLEQFTNRFITESGLPSEQIQAMMPEIQAAYYEAKGNCDRLCEQSSGGSLDELMSIKDIMLQDMTPPFGQYARLNDDEHPHNVTLPYNIFNPNPTISYCIATDKRPYKLPVDYNPNVSPATVSCAAGYKNYVGAVTLVKSHSLDAEQFTDGFEDSYGYSLLAYHPEFCKLKLAETTLKGTYRFASKLQKVETWADAVYGNTLGYSLINTTTTSPTTAANYLMQKDSFFMVAPSSYADMMRNAIISNYVSGNSSCNNQQSMGMWKLAQLAVFCHKEMSENPPTPVNGCLNASTAFQACFSTCINLPPSSSSHCDADMNMVWKNFRSFYISFRNALISQYLSSNCSVNTSIFDANNGYNYQERFPRLQITAPYVVGNWGDIQQLTYSPDQFHEQMQQEAVNACTANTGNWMLRLRQCPAVENLANTNQAQWVSDSTWLSKYLVKICSPGVDYMGHPFGAASLPDNQPAVPVTENPNWASITPFDIRNFPQLITYYLNFRGIAIGAYCYPELIDYPKGYNVAPATVSIPVQTVPEPCVCERINYFKTKWQNLGSPGTFSSYLFNAQGTSISQDTLNLLMAMCSSGYTSTNPNCNFLTSPIKIPAIFQCRGTANPDSSKTCINCADYNSLKQRFYNERGVSAPIEDPQTDAEIALNKSFADFANFHTGFSKTWSEYVEFGKQCAEWGGFDCTELTNLVTEWQATNPPTNGNDCRLSFVQFMNNATGLYLTFSQWMAEFQSVCGQPPPVCQETIDCSQFNILFAGYYHLYGYQVWRNSNCQQLFIDYVNSELQSNFTWEQLSTAYASCTSFCTLDVCSFPNSQLLTVMYNDFRNQMYQSTWSESECQQNFTDWFNEQLGFIEHPFNWDGIVGLYDTFIGRESCVPDVRNVCTPPYSCQQLKDLIDLFASQYPNANGETNCQQQFADFFNEHFSTNYTYSEIAAIYQAVCGSPLEVCNGINWDCKEMILLTQNFPDCVGGMIPASRCDCFTQYFNDHYGTSYTYEELQQLYLEHCGWTLNICSDDHEPSYDCRLLEETLSDFFKKYPDGGASWGVDCETLYRAWFNNKFATNYDFTSISHFYTVLCGSDLVVCQSQCNKYVAFVNSYMSRFGNLHIPLESRQQFFASEFARQFGYDNLTYNDVKTYLAGCIVIPSSLENETQAFTLNDPAVLRDLKMIYYLLHPNGVPENCSTDFTTWIKWIMRVTISYEDLVDMYNSIVGQGAGRICGETEDPARIIPVDPDVIALTNEPKLCGLNVEVFEVPPVDTSTCKDPLQLSIVDATTKWELYLDSLRNTFDTAWTNKCARAKELESFTVSYQKAEYHYTLYYYDQAGNLVKTVPPEGVDNRRTDATFLASVKLERENVSIGYEESQHRVVPGHTLITEYRYNTLGQVVQQKSPDGGLSKFWYDKIARLVVSQNAQQRLDGKYSYTFYDPLGRITQVGQKPQTVQMTETISRSEMDLANWFAGGASTEQITRTVYDVSYFDGDDLLQPEILRQRNLRNRVSYTQVFDLQPSSNTYAGTHRAATYYTYDIHGNADTLLQDYGSADYYANVMNQNGNRYKKIAYDFDLISGKVKMVTYQPGYFSNATQNWVNNPDRFYHRYIYDAEEKLTDVYTSHDSLTWERDASYVYYKHRKLARVVLGQQQVQGIDYAYLLQGLLKGTNSTSVSNGNYDIGGDGIINGANKNVGRDAYGFSLNYYSTIIASTVINDYKTINATVTPFTNTAFSLTTPDNLTIANPCFSSNIASALINIPKLGNPVLYGYGFDQLNRLVSFNAFTGFSNAENNWPNTPLATDNYQERISYDGNGNIKTYLRNGTTEGGNALSMDNLTYGYNYDAANKLQNNKLRHVKDAVGDNNYSGDMDNQPDDNYDYDAIGNLIKDNKDGVTNIIWTVYGKIGTITKNTSSIIYTYDTRGNRISKTADNTTTWYVRDANGNILAIYEQRSDLNSGHLTQTEIHLYGSGRIGVFYVNHDMSQASIEEITRFERGHKYFELGNHLGNVLVNVSDRKLQHNGGNGEVDYYLPDIISANDYYPFGMTMSGRRFGPTDAYRYGFNGKEKDKGISSSPAYDYGFRIYNSGIGRFLSVDPLSKSFPWNSSYAFAENDVVRNIDLDGEEKMHYFLVWDEKQEKASLVFSHAENFTETRTRWTPSWTNWFKTTTTKTKNPRIEYVVHGAVDVPLSADGMFHDETKMVTWTFSSKEKMFEQEKLRRDHHAKGPGAWGPSHDWDYMSCDQHWDIAWTQVLTYSIEAQAEKTIYSPNVYRGIGTRDAIKGTLTNANWAQARTNKLEVFSEEGQAIYSKLAGSSVTTIDDLATALKTGRIVPSQLPIDYVMIQGKRVILNTRTSMALTRAGINRSEWYGIDRTGQQVAGLPAGTTYDKLAANQIQGSNLPATGTPIPPK